MNKDFIMIRNISLLPTLNILPIIGQQAFLIFITLLPIRLLQVSSVRSAHCVISLFRLNFQLEKLENKLQK